MRKLMLILILNICLLFSPPPAPGTTDPNGRYISLNAHAGFFLNPDSYGFIFPAIHPGLLLKQNALRQSRPLFILMGSATGYTIHILTWPFHLQLRKFYLHFWRGIYPQEDVLKIGNFYLGYFLLNVLILWLTLFLFEKIYESQVQHSTEADYVKWLLMVFICSNPVTKAFFWTVHQQMFAFFTPMLCIYFISSARHNQWEKTLHTSIYFLTSGFFLLVYGNFLMLLPCLHIVYFFYHNKIHKHSPVLIRISRIVLFTSIFFMPTFCWILFLKINGIAYYNVELNYYHQLIWIPETLNQSLYLFFRLFLRYSSDFLKTGYLIGVMILASLSLFVVAYPVKVIRNNFFYGSILLFVSFLLFYWMLGFYSDRFTNSLIVFVVLTWLFISRGAGNKKLFICILTSFTFLWQLFLLVSHGPYS